MRMRWLIAGLVVAACGKGPAGPGPVEGRGGEPGGPAVDANDDVTVLRALERAAKNDDGAALDALIHPTLGLWVWDQPGAYVTPSVHLTAGAAVPPSKRWKPDDMNQYWREELWNHVHGPLSRGLAALDRDPADRHAAVYGTCDDMEAGASRAWIATEALPAYYLDIVADAKVELTPLQTTGMVHYHQWGLDVWLMRDQGRLWVAHVMVWTPCDA
jgi:hypothetical protein